MKRAYYLCIALAISILSVTLLIELAGTAQAGLNPAGQSAELYPPAGDISHADYITQTSRSLTRVGSNIYMFGNFANSYYSRYDTTTGTWNSASFTTTTPLKRVGYAAGTLQNKVYISGGQNQSGQKLDDVWRFDPATNTWTEVAQDTRPPARSGHTFVGATTNFIVFGGMPVTDTLASAVWKFDPATGYWSTYGIANPQGPRPGLSAGILGSRMYMVGGEISNSASFVQWTDLMGVQFGNEPITSTARPALRKYQATAFAPETNAIYIFGGVELTTSATLTDAWYLKIGSGTWTRLPDLPKALADAKAAAWYTYPITLTRDTPAVFADGVQVLIVGDQSEGGGQVSYVFDGIEYQLVSSSYRVYLPFARR